jgi:pimeloyl-ACP methyl ester carboxylesterase
MRRLSPVLLRAAVLLAAALACGCAGLVADRIVTPPRSEKQRAFSDTVMRRAGVPWEAAERAFGPDISYVVFEPGDHQLRYRTFSFENRTWSMLMNWQPNDQPRPARHGTVVLVHGWSMDAYMMVPWALAFAEHGFRAVIVELRGHGRSGDGTMGYGRREAGDVLAVIGTLRRQKRLADPLYLMGVSYGAVTVLHAAARLAASDEAHPPLAVVAMEPFANAADAIRSMHTFATTALRGGWRSWILRTSARLLVPEFVVERAIADASRRLELDLGALDTSVAVAASSSCPLLVHGRIDTVIPHRSSRRLAAAHPAAQLAELPIDGHFSTPARVDLLADPLANWFVELARQPGCEPGEETGAGAGCGCVPFRAPASTLLAHDGFERDPIPARQRAQMRPPGGAVLVDPPQTASDDATASE